MVQSDVLQTSKQHLLFSNSISTGLKGNVWSSGLTYVIPLPIIIWSGTNDVVLSFSANDVIPVHPGNTLVLFLAIKGIEICCIVVLFQCGSSSFKFKSFSIKFRIWNNSSSCFMCSTSKIY